MTTSNSIHDWGDLDPEFLKHSDFPYDGPRIERASMTESPFWALTDAAFQAEAVRLGWSCESLERIPTPYGLGPKMDLLTGPDGQRVLYLRDYGRTPGGEYRLRQLYERAFWILWKAGVKQLIVGSHHGSGDWRSGEERVKPGDLLLPWSFESKSWFGGLPGTEYETVWNNPRVTRTREMPWPYLDTPFSESLWLDFSQAVQAQAERPAIVGRIWQSGEVRGVVVNEDGIAFESHYDVFSRVVTCKAISELQPDQAPVIPVYGSLVNPILPKFLGIEYLPYTIISNPGPGMEKDISGTHDANVFSEAAAKFWLACELALFS
ncbi:hypothetical protein [Coraliomargarita parva]|uniref:hypothetical protein n=1 Tax=Coraliomargarita parva TaxID=3014050 RepID=UPI0022B2FBAE|nr:hypothetical protein [Coraliomargarita parva]